MENLKIKEGPIAEEIEPSKETIKKFLTDIISGHSEEVVTVNLLDCGVVFRLQKDLDFGQLLNMRIPAEILDGSFTEIGQVSFEEVVEAQTAVRKLESFGFGGDDVATALDEAIEHFLEDYPDKNNAISLIVQAINGENIIVRINGKIQSDQEEVVLGETDITNADIQQTLVEL